MDKIAINYNLNVINIIDLVYMSNWATYIDAP